MAIFGKADIRRVVDCRGQLPSLHLQAGAKPHNGASSIVRMMTLEQAAGGRPRKCLPFNHTQYVCPY